ncbi:MAG: protein kinase [Polyangiales bacterium]
MSDPRPIPAAEFLTAEELESDRRLEGAELSRVFWVVRGREKERERQEAFWASTNDALARAYRELDEVRHELEALNQQLERRVAEQVEEIVRRAGQIEILNAQLQKRVEERSRELAVALRRLARGSRSHALRRGEELGGRARLLDLIGQGGSGSVYLAEDLLTHAQVVVKVLHACVDPEAIALERFVSEAGAASRISHPGVIKTLHVDVTEDGRVFQIMEHVDGISLHRSTDLGPLAIDSVLRLGAAFANALAAAHAAGVVHRDVKPSNLMICRSEPGVRILDFGISKILGPEDTDQGDLTRRDVFVGTPMYAAPEQLTGAREAGPASDVYSLGLVLFELASGVLPFPTDPTSPHGVDREHPPRRLLELVPDAPLELDVWIHRCLAPKPIARPTARELASHLGRLADDLLAPPLSEVVARELARVRPPEETSYTGDPVQTTRVMPDRPTLRGRT